MQTNAQKSDAQPHSLTTPYFSVTQQVLRMEWEGGQSANPNPERVSLSDLPRIDQWWIAGRYVNKKSS